MKIRQITTYGVSIDFKTALNISGGTNPKANHILVRIETDEGIYGWGEAAPIPQYSDESMESVKAIIDKYLTPLLLGQDPANLARVHETMGQIKGNPFAKGAIDIACYDILGKSLGVPVYTLLGGRYRDRIVIGQSVGIKSIEQMVREAVQYAEEGFQSIKIKVGLNPQEDIRRVREIRKAIGDLPIRVDANQGYRLDEAIYTFTRMEEYDLLLAEQPIARWDLQGMAELCRLLRTPVLADESLFSLQDAINLIRYQAADIFNIKIMKPGGLYPSLKIAAIAEAAEIPLSIGSMIEMGVGTAAGAHFAAAVKHLDYPSDVKGPTLMVDDILQVPVRMEKGYTYVPEGPGLGIDVDMEKVKRYRADV